MNISRLQIVFLFFSLLVHVIILVCVFNAKDYSDKKSQIIEFEVFKVPQGTSLSKTIMTTNKSKFKNFNKAKPTNSNFNSKNLKTSFDQFIPEYKIQTQSEYLAEQKLKGLHDSFYSDPQLIDHYTNHDNSNAKWGVGAGTFERIQNYQLMREVYDTIDQVLFYPSVFVANRVSGTANARLVLNQFGTCDWEKTQITSNDPHIKIYVLYALKKSCSQEFKNFLAKRTQTNIDLSFDFALTEHFDKDIIDQNKYIVGNVLSFYRNSQTSIMKWELGPFEGIFPIPLVNINFYWLQKNWDKYINNIDHLNDFNKEIQVN